MSWTTYTTDATGNISNFSFYTTSATNSPWDYGTAGVWTTAEYSNHTFPSEYIIGDIYRIDDIFRQEQFPSIPIPSIPSPSPPPKPDPERIIAEKRAKALLLEHLDDSNKDRYAKKEPIEIESRLWSDIKYSLPISKLGKICALKKDKVIDRLCLIVRESEPFPLEDIILTKMLHVLYNETEMLRMANHYPDKEGENLLARLT